MQRPADETSTTATSSDGGSEASSQITPASATGRLPDEIPKLTKKGLDKRSYELTIESLRSNDDPYTRYLQKLTSVQFPTLQVVLDFLKTPRGSSRCDKNNDCAQCHYFRASLLACFPDSSAQPYKRVWSSEKHHSTRPDNSVEELLSIMVQLGNTAQPSKRPERLVLLIEDLKPWGLKVVLPSLSRQPPAGTSLTMIQFLGAFLNIDPRTFERLLNFRREFTNEISGVDVLGYNQGYYYRNLQGGKVIRNFKDDLLATCFANGSTRRWWTDVVAHEQRVVVAQIPEKTLVQVPVDAVFLYALPKDKDLKFFSKTLQGSTPQFKLQVIQPFEGVTLFHEYWKEQQPIESDPEDADNLLAIETKVLAAMLNQYIPASSKSFAGAVEFVVEKWTSLASRVQEAISETTAPDVADLGLIRTMTRRRHLFSEAKRTLEPVHDSLNEPCLVEAKANLEKVQHKIDQWIAELDDVLSHTSSTLSLQEAERGMLQSTRTTQLTILAFIFIPLSAVSSGFGMNVDLLKDNPPIWWFFMTSAIVAIVTFAYAAFFRQVNKVFTWSLVRGGLITAALALDAVVLDVKLAVVVFISVPTAVVVSAAFLIIVVLLLLSIPLMAYRGIRLLLSCVSGSFSSSQYSIANELTISWTAIIGMAVLYCVQVWWDFSMLIMDFSPASLDIRRFWRRGKRVPKPYTGTPTPGDCIVM